MKPTIHIAIWLFFLSAWVLLAQNPTLTHRYSFSTDASDSIGNADGLLMNGASVSGGAVILDGSDYVNLPNDLVVGYNAITIEVWVTDNGSGTWARIYDFGNSSGGEDNPATGTQYMFLTLPSGDGNLREASTLNSNGGEEIVEWAGGRPPIGQQTHIVWTSDGTTHEGHLYVDGAEVGNNMNLTVTPDSLGSTLNNWLGRSQWANDPLFNGTIDEFRIYNGALNSETVQRNFELGPDIVETVGPVTIYEQPQSQTVTESRRATFSVGYSGTRPVSVQWYRGSSAISRATNDTYTIPSIMLSDDHAVFSVRLTNVVAGITSTAASTNAVLSVTPDLTAPVLVRASSLFPDGVLVEFSEGLLPATATNISNYAITLNGGTLGVIEAEFGANTSNVVLRTAAQTLSTAYTLTVNGVRDLAAAGNLIKSDSQAQFTATPYLVEDIGASNTVGSLTATAGGYDLVASGSGIGGKSDQFTFGYQSYSGDFDVQVRVASVQFSSAWARAGLMARDGLATNAIFAASFATPGPEGCYFASRSSVGGNATMAGSFPANYPDTWLRLRRQGNAFEGYASLDGKTWDFLGADTLSAPATVQVGLALSAGVSSGSTTAQFRDPGTGSGAIVTNAALPFEPMGPCSRRTALVISEIMYNPRPPGVERPTSNSSNSGTPD